MIGIYLALIGIVGTFAYVGNRTIQFEETCKRHPFLWTLLILASLGIIGAWVVSAQLEIIKVLGSETSGVAKRLFLFLILIFDRRRRERPATPKITKQRTIDADYRNAMDSLSNNPEQSINSMLKKHPNLRKKGVQSGAVKIFENFIEQKQFGKSAKLQHYFDIGKHD